ncbi:tRNA (adenosine(37)-N6)-threonylcarbamoyltransferase complex dimerization subunit type 1 TsaB [Truepera radiovictrix]|uniref:Peptidase M22 glycoprotease n=1 Tax=Truepera radiovictrix (strain DSM 17093 / CIP 108686 / LMG 22925 / RQ-24) TaxID=649638 RepID=D7CRG7_TRURR|nr:tRNA (adenosine(37)-N6)-threonylcarbamoyltransferase complex dimerization subunit type 1 TsaB [Truepera radiovictrix]ADI13457.1 peptidase M22 glycoprotease [Truepera radiovictrix DSM 17093]WMT57982.1 tRNA (adenosine(37)-N6)-threonylcarbamoyltransferase complex dimerization subunit type 1 TsaB [Truepera radiovictrix]
MTDPATNLTGTPLYLGLDTASAFLALALWSPHGGLVAACCEEVGREHARRLPRALDEVFERAGRTPRDLAGVAVGVGPGSYTGLRVGVAAAQGLARGLGVPLRGETSLAAQAASVLGPDLPAALVALDARRGNVYAGVYRYAPQGPVLAGDIVKASRDALRAAHPLPYFENLAPDAGYLARCAQRGASALRPLYL